MATIGLILSIYGRVVWFYSRCWLGIRRGTNQHLALWNTCCTWNPKGGQYMIRGLAYLLRSSVSFALLEVMLRSDGPGSVASWNDGD
jgi:hypothetical protein